MSKLSEEYLKIIKDIEKHISNEEEKKYVLNKVSELSSLYIDLIDRVTDISCSRLDELEEYQDKLEAKITKVKQTLDLIKKDIYEDEDYDFEIVCPYCNHEFVADVEEELREEIECPECHNIIELDWDGEDGGCDGCCSSCGHHEDSDEEVNIEKEKDILDDEDENQDEDDDM